MLDELDTRVKKNLQVLAALANNSLDKDLAKLYTGWGGLRKAIYTPTIYKQLKRYIGEAGVNSIKQTLNSAYYTPELLVRFMWAALARTGFKGGNILEPAVGHGAFLDHIPEDIKHNSNIDAVEIDQVTCQLLIARHPYTNLTCNGFENIYFGNKQYDLIISNPPYSKQMPKDIWYSDLSHLAIHHFFAAKAAKLLKDDGIIAMVLPQFFLDNNKDHARNIISNAGVNLLAAYRLPDRLFTNAKVTVDIVFLQKSSTPNSDVSWLRTKNITINGDTKPMNEYYINNPHHILGELRIVPMYNRTGITCIANGNLRDQLKQVYYQLRQTF